MRNLVAAVLLGVATFASAEPASSAPPATPEPAAPATATAEATAAGSAAPRSVEVAESPPSDSATIHSERATPPLFGLLLDGGFPDGLALSAVARPWRALRADAGFTYNVLGFGVRAGATVLPVAWAIAPLLRAEVGHAFESDASGLARSFGVRASESVLLQAVSYDYASLQVGLQLGGGDRYAFVAQAGLTWFRGPVRNFQAAVRAANPASTIEVSDPTVSGSVPSVSIGFVFFP